MRRRLISPLALLIVCLPVLTSCSGLFGDLNEALYPTATPAAEAQRTAAIMTPIAQPTATIEPAATSTPEGNTVAPATPAPPMDKGQHLVYVQGGSVYRSGYLGENPVEAATVPQLEAWDFFEGQIALAGGIDLQIIDLNTGGLISLIVPAEGEAIYSHVLWGTSGRSLVCAVILEDLQAPTYGRRVELHVYATDGTPIGQMALYDVMDVALLRYDDSSGLLMLIPMGGEPSFVKAETYDLRTGNLMSMLPVQGEGEAIVSPDGHYLLTEKSDKEGAQLMLYDLQAEGQVRPRVWQHPDGAYSLSHLWSSDGRYLAYLLHEGTDGESFNPKGLWVLDVEEMRTSRVVESTSLSSALVGWTPDDVYIVGYHNGEDGGSYFYAVRPDGGDRQILDIDAQATVLGWMPAPALSVPKVVVDPWRRRFLQVDESPEALAGLIAEFATDRLGSDANALTNEITAYLGADDGPAPRLDQVGEGAYMLELASTIYVLHEGQVQPIAQGHLIEARRQGREVGLILGIDIMGSEQQAFMLLQLTNEGVWRIAWTPQGQRDWITSDGEITFGGEGLEILQIRGSSFGLDIGENEVFVECRECPHRWLAAAWLRDGLGYKRITLLGPDAAIGDIYWEMTERTAYAIVYEALRRMRQDLPLDEVIDRATVVEQARDLGLLEVGMRLLVERSDAKEVEFGDLEGQQHFVARLKDGRVVSIKRK